jgi:hypothetical protein
MDPWPIFASGTMTSIQALTEAQIDAQVNAKSLLGEVTMDDKQRDIYVDAALALHGYDFTPGVVNDVKQQFARLAAIADTFVSLPLPVELESASLFIPCLHQQQ